MAEWRKREDNALSEELKIAAHLQDILDFKRGKLESKDIIVRMEGARGERTAVILSDKAATPRMQFTLASALANLSGQTLELHGEPDLMGIKFTIDYPTEELAERVPTLKR